MRNVNSMTIGFVDPAGNTLINIYNDLTIWVDSIGKYGVWRREKKGPHSKGYRWMQMSPFIFKTEQEAQDAIKDNLKGYCVKCEICGLLFQRVSNHLKEHGMTTKEYLNKYPKAELFSEWYREKHAESKHKDWANPNHVYNSPEFREMKRDQLIKMKLSPTAPELAVQNILDQLYPGEWEWVGNGTFWIEGIVNANPDFLNEGRKIVIEVHGCYWHGCSICGYEDKFGSEERDFKKRQTYRENGYEVITFWEHEIFDEEYLISVISFHSEGRKVLV